MTIDSNKQDHKITDLQSAPDTITGLLIHFIYQLYTNSIHNANVNF